MMHKRKDPELIRRYLLGDLNERWQEQFEERLLTDEELQAELSVAQDDLIDDYVSGALPERDQGLFRRNFHLTPERLHKLHLSQALMKYTGAADGISSVLPAVPPISLWQKLSHFLRMRRFAVALSFAVILLVIGYGGWSVYERLQMERQQAELTKLNKEQLSGQQLSTITVALKLHMVRDAGAMRRVVVTEGTDVVQLGLELDEDKFSAYRAMIETEEGVGLYTIEDLKASATSEGKAVYLNLPGRLLSTGNYQVHLSGITSGGQTIEIGVYPFEIVLM